MGRAAPYYVQNLPFVKETRLMNADIYAASKGLGSFSPLILPANYNI